MGPPIHPASLPFLHHANLLANDRPGAAPPGPGPARPGRARAILEARGPIRIVIVERADQHRQEAGLAAENPVDAAPAHLQPRLRVLPREHRAELLGRRPLTHQLRRRCLRRLPR